jgi:protein-S-isoprenylcysteine O-methyltransferase Ste14
MRRLGYALATFVMVSIYLGLSVWAEGGLMRFASHPALIGLALATYASGFAAMFTPGTLSSGVREDRSNRWVLIPFGLIGLISGFLPALTDARNFATIDREAIRWPGLLLFCLGCGLRLAPVFALGNRFSGLVAIQPGHQLKTDGLYRWVRNPSYVGLILINLGWALAFRAWAGVALCALMIPVLIARMDSEEKLLASQFGADYAAYRARTWRLVPWVY